MSLLLYLLLAAATLHAQTPPPNPRDLALTEELARRHAPAEQILRDAARDNPNPAFLGEAAYWMAQQFSPFGNNPNVQVSLDWLRIAAAEFRTHSLNAQLARALHASALATTQGPAKRRMLEEARTAAQAGGDPRDLAVIEAEWAEALRSSGDLTAAIQLLQNAIARLEALQAWSEAGRALSLLGRAYAVHGQYRDAETALARGEQAYQTARDLPGVMLIRADRGVLLAFTGQSRSAIETLDSVLDYLISSQLTPAARLRYSGIAIGYLAAGEYARAADLAETIQRRYPRRAPAMVHSVKACAYYHLGRYDDAVTAATAGIDANRGSVFSRREFFHWRSLALHKLDRRDLAAADMLEAVRLDDSLRDGLLPDDEWKRAFEETREPLAQDAVAVLWTAGRHREALDAAELFRARALRDLLATRNSAKPEPAASAAQLAAYAAQSRVPVLAYWVHPQAVYVWLVDPQGNIRAVRSAVTQARLRQLVRRAGTLGYKPDRDAWRELSSVLLQPVRRFLPAGVPALAIVSHADLLQLPFGALLDPAGRYLAEDFVLHYAPSATLLLAAPPATPHRGSLLLIGEPIGSRRALLPGARRELETIAALAPARTTLLAAGHAITARFTQAAHKAQVLHFATHAVLDAARPADSFLALSHGNKLTAAQIYDLPLRADLVMLSACRGGAGRLSADGLLGLTRAFLSAGASRVIAPVWDLPDEPAVLLVAEFYRQYLSGVPPSQALRTAQLKLLADLRAGRVTVQTPAGPMILPEHPTLWAGFILQGGL